MKRLTKIFYLLDWISDNQNSKYLKIISVNPVHLNFNKENRYFEEIHKNKYLMVVPTNKSKEM